MTTYDAVTVLLDAERSTRNTKKMLLEIRRAAITLNFSDEEIKQLEVRFEYRSHVNEDIYPVYANVKGGRR